MEACYHSAITSNIVHFADNTSRRAGSGSLSSLERVIQEAREDFRDGNAELDRSPGVVIDLENPGGISMAPSASESSTVNPPGDAPLN